MEAAGSDRRERMVDDEMVEVIVCGMAKANWEGSHQRRICYVDGYDVHYG